MEDLKIRVANMAESKEAQELFFELGAKWRSQINREEAAYVINIEYPSIILHGGDMSLNWNTIEQFNSLSYYKEITLQELRDMVNPMKEYLEPSNNYSLIKTHRKEGNDWIEVPEGAIRARFYPADPDNLEFENQFAQWWHTDELEWIYYMDQASYNHSRIVWQRHTQPEELPFVDSLNDQYAEIEQVRKQTIEATLAERQAQYGCFEDVARTTGKIMEALSEVRVNGLNDLPYPHRMALYMIASKMARIVNGDFNYRDNWHDIGGYSKLVEDLL